MSAVLISSEFISYAGVVATFLFTVPITVKIVHIVRSQVRKILAALEGEESDDDEGDDDPA